jgi:hypothetical protein
VIQSIIAGNDNPPLGRTGEDVQVVRDLGLVDYSDTRGFIIANPGYEEIIIRYLDSAYHDSAPPPSSWRWAKPDGALDMVALLREFQDFWETNSETWESKADYTEAFPHLLLLAFLQRVTNGTGRIYREYAAGSGRMDIAVEYKGKWNIIEIKLWRQKQGYERLKKKGLEQIRTYAGKFPHTEGLYLVIFDRRPEALTLDWDKKLTWQQEEDVSIVGC